MSVNLKSGWFAKSSDNQVFGPMAESELRKQLVEHSNKIIEVRKGSGAWVQASRARAAFAQPDANGIFLKSAQGEQFGPYVQEKAIGLINTVPGKFVAWKQGQDSAWQHLNGSLDNESSAQAAQVPVPPPPINHPPMSIAAPAVATQPPLAQPVRTVGVSVRRNNNRTSSLLVGGIAAFIFTLVISLVAVASLLSKKSVQPRSAGTNLEDKTVDELVTLARDKRELGDKASSNGLMVLDMAAIDKDPNLVAIHQEWEGASMDFVDSFGQLFTLVEESKRAGVRSYANLKNCSARERPYLERINQQVKQADQAFSRGQKLYAKLPKTELPPPAPRDENEFKPKGAVPRYYGLEPEDRAKDYFR